MYLVKMPSMIKPVLGEELICTIPSGEKSLFLTFDDGPTEEITYQILDILDQYKAEATFFCIGGNVEKHPLIYQHIIDRGHAVGNHTWNHMNSWEFADYSYYKNVLQCQKLVHSTLFRPPYGKIKPNQVKVLSRHFNIIMWDVISGDWDHSISQEKCLDNVLSNVRPGSVVVFHDSEKAKDNMLYSLPKALEAWSSEGYSFNKIEL